MAFTKISFIFISISLCLYASFQCTAAPVKDAPKSVKVVRKPSPSPPSIVSIKSSAKQIKQPPKDNKIKERLRNEKAKLEPLKEKVPSKVLPNVKQINGNKVNKNKSKIAQPLRKEISSKQVSNIKKTKTKDVNNRKNNIDEYLKPNARIVRGEPVLTKKEFPFVVDISNSDTAISSRRFCTGSLISHNMILTAAHCVINQGYTAPVYATIGRIELEDNHEDNKPSLTYRTVASMVHPQYDGIGSPYDVGVLLLNESCETVAPVALSNKPPAKGSKPWVVGYGIQRIGTLEEVSQAVEILTGRLQKTQLDIVDRHMCDIPSADTETKEGLLCTKGVKNGASACMGDSGGGLFLKSSSNSSTHNIVQVGIVSYGDSQCASEEAGVFTEVSHVREWIRYASGKLESLTHSSSSLKIVLDDDVGKSPLKELSHHDDVRGKMLVHYQPGGFKNKIISIPESQAVIAITAHHAKYYTVITNFSKPTNVRVSLCKSPPGTIAKLSVFNERNNRVFSDSGSCNDKKLSQLVVRGLTKDRLTVGVSGNGTLPIRLTFSSEK